MISARSAAALVSASLLLGGCIEGIGLGGGGSGGTTSPTVSDPLPAIAEAQTAGADRSRDASAEAAVALPRFGSVTQSSNSAFGVTTDTASTAFDGNRLTLRIDRRRGSDSVLEPVPDGASYIDASPAMAGHSGRFYALAGVTDAGVSVAVAYTSWDNADPTDYLAGGYWMHLEADLNAPDLFELEVGAFIDGPELSGTPTLPVSGTASYRGSAVGLYAYEYGGGHAQSATHLADVGQYEGSVTLTANFGANWISGRIDEVSVSGFRTARDGRETEFHDEAPFAQVALGAATIRPDGRFSNSDVRVVAGAGRVIGPTGGSWGGGFSHIPDAAGDPRLVAGTAGAEWSEPDGSRGAVIGAYFATGSQ